MLEILRDSIWQFILGFIALALTIIFYWKQTQRKNLSFEVLYNTNLLSIDDVIKGKTQILYEGQLVQNVRLYAIKLINSGNVAILDTDYVRPVYLDFGNDSSILSAKVAKTSPSNLSPCVTTEKTRIIIDPLLLNSGDFIELEILLSQPTEYRQTLASIDGRIVGVKSIKQINKLGQNRIIRLYSVTAFITVLIGIASYVLSGFKYPNLIVIFSVAAALSLIGGLIGIYLIDWIDKIVKL